MTLAKPELLSVPRRIWRLAALALFALLASMAVAQSSAPKFTLTKDACLGQVTGLADPSNCQPAESVASGTVGYYMITLTNPWSQPQQTIDVTDAIPAQFTPAVGAIFCRDENNQPVAWTPSSSAILMSVPLGVGQTVHCFIGGTFASGGAAVTTTTTASGINKTGYSVSDSAKADVLPSSALGTNLKITKLVSQPTVDITSGPQTVTYTIKITNTGPVPVTVGQYFWLHDDFSLLANSVPLNTAISNAQCIATPGTDCLDSGGPQFDSQWNSFVGSMGVHHAFDWGFGSTAGVIALNGTITLTFDVTLTPIDGIDCVADKFVNAQLHNNAFFTLTDEQSSSAKFDSNPADNTAAVDLKVQTPFNEVYEGCGTSQLQVSKIQISPANSVAWGQTVNYDIHIKNVSVPAQTITVKKHDLVDSVQEGINTPPFDRQHVATSCDPSMSSPGVCGPFASSGFNQAGSHHYAYYLEMDQAWDSNKDLKLDPGEEAVFHTSFIYAKPDCETVPKAPKRPIFNHVRATYKASPYGSPPGTDGVMMSSGAKVETLMKEQPPCRFVVTKSGGPVDGKLQFSIWNTYKVTFTNSGPARNIGTVMDAVRISIPDYASMLPFSSSWNCTGVATVSGSQTSGMATYVPTPAMGAPAALINLASNTYFPSGGSLQCLVKIKVERPPLNDIYCTSKPAYFENLALMDVTTPFNNSIAWPPSGIYAAPPTLSNPPSQIYNWASVRLALPKCWDLKVDKTATVDGLPTGSAPWTFAGNTGHDVHFQIGVTNLSDSTIAATSPASLTPPNGGWDVTDKLASGSVYNAGMLGFESCAPPAWCYWNTGPGNNGMGKIGVRNLNPLQKGVWKNKLGWNNVQSGNDIRNCAWIIPVATVNSAEWYNRQYAVLPSFNCAATSSATTPCASGSTGALFSYACVPVLETTQITVKKVIVDQTPGAPVTTAPGAYGVTVSCTPFAIPTWVTSNFNLAAGGPGQTVSVVPMGGTCSVAEVGSPIPPAISTKCGGAANVVESVSYSPLPSPLAPKASAALNTVTVTNTYACKGSPVLVVGKKFLNPEVPNGGGPFPPMSFPVTVTCIPGGVQNQSVATTGNTVSSISFPVALGAVCQVVENIAAVPFPQNAIDFCAGMSPSKIPVWKPPVYNPQNGTPPGTAITIGNGTNQVLIKNEWKCDNPLPAGGQLEVIKELNTIQTPVQFPATTWTINSSCLPGGSIGLTTPASGNAQITASYPNSANPTPIIQPIGTICPVSETLPSNSLIPQWFKNNCVNQGATAVWNQPEYSINNGPYSTTPPSVAIVAGVTTVRVRNGWHCQPNPPQGGTVSLQVFKKVVGPTQQVPQMTFALQANCSPAASPSTVNVTTNYPHSNYTGGGAFSVPTGGSCTFGETPPDPKQIAAMVAYCSVQAPNIEPKWLPPVWSTSPTGTPALVQPYSAGSTLNLYVINTWVCGPPATAKVKPKSKPKIKINIGIGGLFGRGGGGDKPKDPPPGDPVQNPPRPLLTGTAGSTQRQLAQAAQEDGHETIVTLADRFRAGDGAGDGGLGDLHGPRRGAGGRGQASAHRSRWQAPDRAQDRSKGDASAEWA